MLHVQQVPRRSEYCGRLRLEHPHTPARVEVADIDARARGVEAHHLIKEVAAVGKKLRPGDCDVARRLIERGYEHGIRDRSTNRVESPRPVREEDRVVGCPSSAGRGEADGRDRPHVAVADVDRLELAVGEEPEPARVGRPERPQSAFGVLEPFERRRVQHAHPERRRTARIVAGDEGQRLTVGRQCAARYDRGAFGRWLKEPHGSLRRLGGTLGSHGRTVHVSRDDERAANGQHDGGAREHRAAGREPDGESSRARRRRDRIWSGLCERAPAAPAQGERRSR